MREFFEAFWQNTDQPGSIVFWFAPSKKSLHLPLRQLPNMDESDIGALQKQYPDQHVYFGLGLRDEDTPKNKQGGKQNIIALPGLPIDIDFFNPKAHKAKNLPSGWEEAYSFIKHLPDPSIIVSTGNGGHLYYLLKEPIYVYSPTDRTYLQKTIKAFQGPIIQAAADQGFHVDSTASIQRVWRVPGFVNRKTDKPVVLEHCDPNARYSLQDLGLSLPAPKSKPPEPSKPYEVQDDDIDESDPLFEVKTTLKNIGEDHYLYDAVQALLKGESIAERGERDETLQRVCSLITWLPCGRSMNPETLAELFRPTFEIWSSEDDEEGNVKTVDDEMEKALDKIIRSQEDFWYQDRRKYEPYRGIAKALGIDLPSPEQIEEMEANGEDFEKIATDWLAHHSIIQYKAAHYIFDFTEQQYSPLKVQNEIVPVIREAWKEAPPGVDFHYENSKGELKTMTVPRICEEYCMNVDKVIADLTIDHSIYEREKKTFREAICQKRVTEAVFDPQIDEWLRLMIGDEVAKFDNEIERPLIDLFLDWVAAVPLLSEQNSALYLDGYSGAGKGLLSNGLARIWHEGAPTDFEDAIGQFNSDLLNCPLVRIDEGIGGNGKRKDITAKLRALVGRQSFSINEKGVPQRPVYGTVRLIICANNDNVLMLGDSEFTMKDLEAVVNRIFYVEARKEAAEWLQEHNEGGYLTREWVEGDGIARHCLWLSENRDIVRGKRFMVEGPITGMHTRLVMQGDTDGLIYEWLAKYATNPQPILNRYQRKPSELVGAKILDGEIYLNTSCLDECWDVYMKAENKPKSTRMGRILSKLACRRARLGSKFGNRVWFHVIEPKMVLEWCKANQIGNEEKIEINLRQDWDGNNGEMESDERNAT